MSQSQNLVEQIEASSHELDSVADRESIRRLWFSLSGEPADEDGAEHAEIFVDAVQGALELAAGEDLQLKPGLAGWKIDLSRGIVKSLLAAAFLSALLIITGTAAVSPLVLPAVVPLLFEVRRVSLRASDRELLAELVLTPDVKSGRLTADELYQRLPEDTRARISRPDFANFLERLRDAGVARETDATFQVNPDKPRFHLRIV